MRVMPSSFNQFGQGISQIVGQRVEVFRIEFEGMHLRCKLGLNSGVHLGEFYPETAGVVCHTHI